MSTISAITGGLYLVIDPQKPIEQLLSQLEAALSSNTIQVVQVWDHWNPQQDPIALLQRIHPITQRYQIPLLVNNQWQLLQQLPLEGVHFDEVPTNLAQLTKAIGRSVVVGITLSNDLRSLAEIDQNSLSYISFCSVFPSPTVQTCTLVDRTTLQQVRQHTQLPVFVSGGITPDNLHQLPEDSYDGVALISGIMQAADAKQAALTYAALIHP